MGLTNWPPVPHQAVEFHEDLFPDTAGSVPASDAHTWWAGDNQKVGPSRGREPPLLSPGPSNPWEFPFGSLNLVSTPPRVPFIPGSMCLPQSPAYPQVQKISLNPAHRPHPSFISSLVPTMEPSPDMAHPAELPRADTDPSVSTKSPPLWLLRHHRRVVKWSRGVFYSPVK